MHAITKKVEEHSPVRWRPQKHGLGSGCPRLPTRDFALQTEGLTLGVRAEGFPLLGVPRGSSVSKEPGAILAVGLAHG